MASVGLKPLILPKLVAEGTSSDSPSSPPPSNPITTRMVPSSDAFASLLLDEELPVDSALPTSMSSSTSTSTTSTTSTATAMVPTKHLQQIQHPNYHGFSYSESSSPLTSPSPFSTGVSTAATSSSSSTISSTSSFASSSYPVESYLMSSKMVSLSSQHSRFPSTTSSFDFSEYTLAPLKVSAPVTAAANPTLAPVPGFTPKYGVTSGPSTSTTTTAPSTMAASKPIPIPISVPTPPLQTAKPPSFAPTSVNANPSVTNTIIHTTTTPSSFHVTSPATIPTSPLTFTKPIATKPQLPNVVEEEEASDFHSPCSPSYSLSEEILTASFNPSCDIDYEIGFFNASSDLPTASHDLYDDPSSLHSHSRSHSMITSSMNAHGNGGHGQTIPDGPPSGPKPHSLASSLSSRLHNLSSRLTSSSAKASTSLTHSKSRSSGRSSPASFSSLSHHPHHQPNSSASPNLLSQSVSNHSSVGPAATSFDHYFHSTVPSSPAFSRPASARSSSVSNSYLSTVDISINPVLAKERIVAAHDLRGSARCSWDPVDNRATAHAGHSNNHFLGTSEDIDKINKDRGTSTTPLLPPLLTELSVDVTNPTAPNPSATTASQHNATSTTVTNVLLPTSPIAPSPTSAISGANVVPGPLSASVNHTHTNTNATPPLSAKPSFSSSVRPRPDASGSRHSWESRYQVGSRGSGSVMSSDDAPVTLLHSAVPAGSIASVASIHSNTAPSTTVSTPATSNPSATNVHVFQSGSGVPATPLTGSMMATSAYPFPLMLPEHDSWFDKLGHANYTIYPSPYQPEVFSVDALLKLRQDWETARVNYAKHVVRTGENYGHTSRIYALTEEKWAEIDGQWRKNHDIVQDALVAANLFSPHPKNGREPVRQNSVTASTVSSSTSLFQSIFATNGSAGPGAAASSSPSSSSFYGLSNSPSSKRGSLRGRSRGNSLGLPTRKRSSRSASVSTRVSGGHAAVHSSSIAASFYSLKRHPSKGSGSVNGSCACSVVDGGKAPTDLEWQRVKSSALASIPRMLKGYHGKFPSMGDEDIVGPMTRDEVMLRVPCDEQGRPIPASEATATTTPGAVANMNTGSTSFLARSSTMASGAGASSSSSSAMFPNTAPASLAATPRTSITMDGGGGGAYVPLHATHQNIPQMYNHVSGPVVTNPTSPLAMMVSRQGTPVTMTCGEQQQQQQQEGEGEGEDGSTMRYLWKTLMDKVSISRRR